MKFLVDEDLPRSMVKILREHGHEAIDVREVGLGGAKDNQVIAYARERGLCLITGDFDFSDIRNYPPTKHHGLVILGIPNDLSASFIIKLLEQFLQEKETLAKLSGKLVIVEPGRFRIRSS